MDSEDQKDIIKKVKEAGKGDKNVSPESDEDMPSDEDMSTDKDMPTDEPSDEEGIEEYYIFEHIDNLFLDEPKKNNMFQEGSNDILDESDRCTRIAKSKYDVWPSAYASGAVVRCRKGKIWKGLKEEDLKEMGDYKSMTDEQLDEKWSQKYKKNIDCDNPKGFSQKAHCQGKKKHDESIEEAAKKTYFSKEKESGLHGWFSRRGGEGSKGWVDCNTCKDGKCKPCGREDGESRAKYPSCRPTPSACKTKGKGDSWGKKSANESEYSVYENQEITNYVQINENENNIAIGDEVMYQNTKWKVINIINNLVILSQMGDDGTLGIKTTVFASKVTKLNESLRISEKNSIFDKIKSKLQETFNQEEMNSPTIEPQVEPQPQTRPDTTRPRVSPSRRNKPFLPEPSVQPDPKAVK